MFKYLQGFVLIRKKQALNRTSSEVPLGELILWNERARHRAMHGMASAKTWLSADCTERHNCFLLGTKVGEPRLPSRSSKHNSLTDQHDHFRKKKIKQIKEKTHTTIRCGPCWRLNNWQRFSRREKPSQFTKKACFKGCNLFPLRREAW